MNTIDAADAAPQRADEVGTYLARGTARSRSWRPPSANPVTAQLLPGYRGYSNDPEAALCRWR
ncbi:hypothetical protein EF847_08350 [Actinobacteria bacterium YIM 96077]|uniref:Uncharacterized protein n=1 Tax=Phytoactinopolyspora halophila TaxID=1981511 RepID=A0A329QVN8_9ACTN|nr:hypothetical protein EF847_08350 [Actinobacteria bacterium YIM 96077]RAW16484.1 hypothetical protein DPM12_07670 [Phytoactinopolyspora halophila]